MSLEIDFESKEEYGDSDMINEIRIAYLFDPSMHDITQISQGVFNPEKDDSCSHMRSKKQWIG